MTCKGQIAEQNANEHVLAIAPQGNLQLSPNFFWNFSHHIPMFLTLSQYFSAFFLIFQTGLRYKCQQQHLAIIISKMCQTIIDNWFVALPILLNRYIPKLFWGGVLKIYGLKNYVNVNMIIPEIADLNIVKMLRM